MHREDFTLWGQGNSKELGQKAQITGILVPALIMKQIYHISDFSSRKWENESQNPSAAHQPSTPALLQLLSGQGQTEHSLIASVVTKPPHFYPWPPNLLLRQRFERLPKFSSPVVGGPWQSFSCTVRILPYMPWYWPSTQPFVSIVISKQTIIFHSTE